METENPALFDLAGAILDGAPLDWDAIASGTPASDRDLVGALRAVTAIGRFHRPASSLAAAGPPQQWGHLTLIERIGNGTFGRVYRAHDVTLDRDVALKLIPADHAAGDALQEGRLLAKVHHPNVVTIHGADRQGGFVGLWMELVRGETLAQVLTRTGPMDPPRVVAVGRQLCDALGAVHDAGLLHRDVKAHNVVLTEAGRLVLMDFGASRLVAFDDGALAGTPLYLAPEIFAGRDATARSDLYSLGVLLFHLLTGSYPVQARSLNDLRDWHATGSAIVRLQSIRPAVPRRLADSIERALAQQPTARYASAAEMGSALAASLHESRISRRVMIAVGVGAITGAVATYPRGWSRLGWRMPPASAGVGAGLDDETSASARRLTLPNAALWGAGLSHDGYWFAYTTQEGGIAIYELSSGRVETVVDAQNGESAEFAIASPDGQQIAYQWWTARQHIQIRIADRSATRPRVVLQDETLDYALPVEWSRDASEILAVGRTREGAGRIWLLDVVTGTRTVVREFTGPEPGGLSLSPDRQHVVYDFPSRPDSDTHWLRIVRRDGSDDRRLLADSDHDERTPLWSPDGRSVFFTSDRAGIPDGWLVGVENGAATDEPSIVLRNLVGTTALSLTTRGTLAYRVRTGAFEVFELALDAAGAVAAGPPRRVPIRARGAVLGPSYSPDGRLLAVTVRQDGLRPRPALVVIERESGREREVTTTFAFQAGPRWSPDGQRMLVRGVIAPAKHGILVIDPGSGAVLHTIVSFSDSQVSEYGPIAWSGDRDHVLYGQAARGLVRHSLVDGSDALVYSLAQLPVRRIQRLQVSPDGKALAFSGPRRDGRGSALMLGYEGGFVELVQSEPPAMVSLQGWSGDGAFVYYTAPDVSRRPPHQLWRVPAAGGSAEELPIAIPGATQLNGLSFDPAGMTLAYTAGFPESELWIRDGFLPTSGGV